MSTSLTQEFFDFWNDGNGPGSVTSTNNCYTFAVNYPFGEPVTGPNFSKGKNNGRANYTEPQPGEFGGIPYYEFGEGDMKGVANCENLERAALSDKFGIVRPSNHQCKEGYYEIYFSHDSSYGMHVYRQMKDGSWVEKHGVGLKVDPVGDPKIRKNRRKYSTLCNLLCVPFKKPI